LFRDNVLFRHLLSNILQIQKASFLVVAGSLLFPVYKNGKNCGTLLAISQRWTPQSAVFTAGFVVAVL
jgi:hypothetical protein